MKWMNRITTDNDTTKSIKRDNRLGESMYYSNCLILSALILFIHVQMLFIELLPFALPLLRRSSNSLAIKVIPPLRLTLDAPGCIRFGVERDSS